MESKVKAILEYSIPKTVRALQRFLGAVNFYHQFIPMAADIAIPLYQVIDGPKCKTIKCNSKLDAAFTKIKQSLAKRALLNHPISEAPLAVTSDASYTAMGAVLEQFNNRHWEPLAFFSRQFKGAEKSYATFDKELTGVFTALKHFKYSLEGRRFRIFTDHKPILAALNKKSEPTSGRQARQLSAIAEMTSDIEHISGKKTSWRTLYQELTKSTNQNTK